MVKQYPYTGIVKLASESNLVDGKWTTGEPLSELLTVECRSEPARANQYIRGNDGDKILLSCIVYMPPIKTELRPGMLFEVWDGNRLIVSEPIKQFSLGQLNARVWL